MKIAIPQFGTQIAPCFEAAGTFWIAEVDKSNRVLSSQVVNLSGQEGLRRVRLLQMHKVGTLICNGIKGFYRDMLTASGVTVICNIGESFSTTLKKYLAGELTTHSCPPDEAFESCSISHNDLVDWAKNLFESHGYRVTPAPDKDHYLVDLVAKIECPCCHRTVKVAICCGAQTYRHSQEIQEFHHATPSGYHARVYICPSRPNIEECCREYGIELIDPDTKDIAGEPHSPDKLPILQGPVLNHEKASLATPKKTGKEIHTTQNNLQ